MIYLVYMYAYIYTYSYTCTHLGRGVIDLECCACVDRSGVVLAHHKKGGRAVTPGRGGRQEVRNTYV